MTLLSFIYDPLEQFDVINLCNITIFRFFPNNLSFVLFMNVLLIVFFIEFLLKNSMVFFYNYSSEFNDFSVNKKIYNKSVIKETKRGSVIWTDILFDTTVNSFLFLFSSVLKFAKSLSIENINIRKNNFIYTIVVLFIMVIISNLIGMVPLSYTVTSSLVFTIFFSLSFFIATNIIGYFLHRSGIFKLFLPPGSPLFIVPLLTIIELISYLSRIFSLSIRLFANMLSGHALLKILISFAWLALILLDFTVFVSFLQWSVIDIIITLELAIAVLQAYVFSILICIYLNDSIHPH